jgi:hypothetical protein
VLGGTLVGSLAESAFLTSSDFFPQIPNEYYSILAYLQRENSYFLYYIIKNDWDDSWGLNGYGLINRWNYNICGIMNKAFIEI